MHCVCHMSDGKKLRYMSKIAAIFVRTDNTQWDFTQPMSNLLMLGSQVLPVLLLTSPYNIILAGHEALSYFAIDSCGETRLKSVTFA